MVKKIKEKEGEEKKKKSSKIDKELLKKSELIEKGQPEVNIGLVGHVDHGKTTLTYALSGRWTDTHSEEIKRGITIRLGYADAVFRQCPKCKIYTVEKKCPECGSDTVAVRKVSFVDAPGHESLMATMLSGATIMDGAILLVSANEDCPQPQTKEHLMALQVVGIKNVVVVQNKIDTVTKEEALRNYKQIKEFLKGTDYKDAPIIPISAQQRINIGFLIKAIQETIKTPERDPNKDPLMLIARSFDINKPGTDINNIVGGVLGGALVQGILRKSDEIEIRPGIRIEKDGKPRYVMIKTKIVDIKTGGFSVNEIRPGGSVGVMTKLDPAIVKSDSLSGNVAGYPDKLPPILNSLKLDVNLLERVVGTKKEINVEPIKPNELLMLNVNSSATVGVVNKISKNAIECSLKLPVCAYVGSRVTISRMLGNRWRLIGWGIIK